MVFKAKANVEAVINMIKDFVNDSDQIKEMQKYLVYPSIIENPDFDLISVYKTLKMMRYVKNQLQSTPNISPEIIDNFKSKFQHIDRTYHQFEQVLLNGIADVPKNLARSAPHFVV